MLTGPVDVEASCSSSQIPELWQSLKFSICLAQHWMQLTQQPAEKHSPHQRIVWRMAKPNFDQRLHFLLRPKQHHLYGTKRLLCCGSSPNPNLTYQHSENCLKRQTWHGHARVIWIVDIFLVPTRNLKQPHLQTSSACVEVW